MTTEDDVRTMLRHHAEDAHVSDDAWERIQDRLGDPGARRRPLLPVIAAAAVAAAVLVAAVVVWPQDDTTNVVTPATPTTAAHDPADLPPHVWASQEGASLADTAAEYVEARTGGRTGVQPPVMTDESHATVLVRDETFVTDLLMERSGERWLVIAAQSARAPIRDAVYDGTTFTATVVPAVDGYLGLMIRSRGEDRAAESFVNLSSRNVYDGVDVRVRHDKAGEPGLGLIARLSFGDGTVALSEVWVEERHDTITGGITSVWPATDDAGLAALQAEADAGRRPDLLDPVAVARSFLSEVLDGSTPFSLDEFQQGDNLSGEVPYSLDASPAGTILVRREGPGGIWHVSGAVSHLLELRSYDRDAHRFEVFAGYAGNRVDALVRTTGGGVSTGTTELSEHQAEAVVGVPDTTGARWVQLVLRDLSPERSRVVAVAVSPL